MRTLAGSGGGRMEVRYEAKAVKDMKGLAPADRSGVEERSEHEMTGP